MKKKKVESFLTITVGMAKDNSFLKIIDENDFSVRDDLENKLDGICNHFDDKDSKKSVYLYISKSEVLKKSEVCFHLHFFDFKPEEEQFLHINTFKAYNFFVPTESRRAIADSILQNINRAIQRFENAISAKN